MLQNPFKKCSLWDWTVLASLCAVAAGKIYLFYNNIRIEKEWTAVHPFFLWVFGIALLNLLVFAFTAYATGGKQKAWWEGEKKHNAFIEKGFSFWAKTLVFSFVVFWIGLMCLLLFYSSVFIMLVFFIPYFSQRVAQAFQQRSQKE